MAMEHLAKTFEEELKRLHSLISRMGGLSESQLADAIRAVTERDSELAAEVVESDPKVGRGGAGGGGWGPEGAGAPPADGGRPALDPLGVEDQRRARADGGLRHQRRQAVAGAE